MSVVLRPGRAVGVIEATTSERVLPADARGLEAFPAGDAEMTDGALLLYAGTETRHRACGWTRNRAVGSVI